MTESNGWSRYEELVLSELKRLSLMQTTMRNDLHRLESQLAVLHVKVGWLAGFFGLLGGAIPLAVAMILKQL